MNFKYLFENKENVNINLFALVFLRQINKETSACGGKGKGSLPVFETSFAYFDYAMFVLRTPQTDGRQGDRVKFKLEKLPSLLCRISELMHHYISGRGNRT